MEISNDNVTCFPNLNVGSDAFKALDKKGLLGDKFTTRSGEVRYYINSKAFAEYMDKFFVYGKAYISDKGVTFEKIYISGNNGGANNDMYDTLAAAMKAEVPNAFKTAMKAGV